MMITNEPFDIDIDELNGKSGIDFTFEPEKELHQPYNIYIVRDGSTGKETDRYKLKHFLYGRIRIGSESYFSEVVGYEHPDAPLVTTYHIVSIFDATFFSKYRLNCSYSDFSEDDIFEFL